MKRTERVGAMLQILRENPNKTFSLGYFCDMFDCAKSSLSEDVSAAKRALEISGYGRIETVGLVIVDPPAIAPRSRRIESQRTGRTHSREQTRRSTKNIRPALL